MGAPAGTNLGWAWGWRWDPKTPSPERVSGAVGGSLGRMLRVHYAKGVTTPRRQHPHPTGQRGTPSGQARVRPRPGRPHRIPATPERCLPAVEKSPSCGDCAGTPWALRAGLGGTIPSLGPRGGSLLPQAWPRLSVCLCPSPSIRSASVLPTGCGGPSWAPSVPSRSRGAGVTWHWEAGALPHSHPGCDTSPSSPSSGLPHKGGRQRLQLSCSSAQSQPRGALPVPH